jgi:hypothetical protein
LLTVSTGRNRPIAAPRERQQSANSSHRVSIKLGRLSLPFPHDQHSAPLSELKNSAAGNRYHFQLTTSGDEISFIVTASPDHRWYDKQSHGPLLHDFAVKRFFEIYRTDQGK